MSSRPLALPEEAQGEAGPARPWLTLLAVSLGVIMVMLDGTVVAIANPVIGAELRGLARRPPVGHQRRSASLAIFLISPPASSVTSSAKKARCS